MCDQRCLSISQMQASAQTEVATRCHVEQWQLRCVSVDGDLAFLFGTGVLAERCSETWLNRRATAGHSTR